MELPGIAQWNDMWRQARHRQSWRGRSATDWDRRSASFARRHHRSPFTDRLLSLLAPEPDWTVLDIGSGPGNLTLPLARRVRRVTAIDFSAAMLDLLQENAARQGISSITTVHAAWEDDWPGVGPHDLVLASRSLAVDDLAGALARIDRLADRLAVVVERAGDGPFDPEIFAAVGRPYSAGPDYIYIVNILHAMGIHARVDFITMPAAASYPSRRQAFESCAWMLENPTPEEEKRLAAFLDSRLEPGPDNTLVLSRRHPARWTVISWRPQNPPPDSGMKKNRL